MTLWITSEDIIEQQVNMKLSFKTSLIGRKHKNSDSKNCREKPDSNNKSQIRS